MDTLQGTTSATHIGGTQFNRMGSVISETNRIGSLIGDPRSRGNSLNQDIIIQNQLGHTESAKNFSDHN